MASKDHEDLKNSCVTNSVILPDDSDHSLLQQPLNAGVKNVKQILKCIQNGSPEVKDLVLNECNIIYECKLCFNLFRSLANFLYHKRAYCKNHLCENMLLFETQKETEINESSLNNKEIDVESDSNDSASKYKEVIDVNSPNKLSPSNSRGESSSVDPIGYVYLMEKDFAAKQNDKHPSGKELSNEKKINNFEIFTKSCVSSSLTEKKITENIPSNEIITVQGSKKAPLCTKALEFEESIVSPVILEPISGNSNAVLQKISKHDENEKSDAEHISEQKSMTIQSRSSESETCKRLLKKPLKSVSPTVATKGVAKSVHLTRKNRQKDCDVAQRVCFKCHTQFTTLKNLYYHMVSFHSQARLYYPCPFCTTFFLQMHSVTKHLIQVHDKKKEQVNKLKELIRKKAIWKHSNENSKTGENKKNDSQRQELVSTKSENDLKNVEKKVFHCSKCSRIFSRKSSQVSHEKFCIMNNSQQQEKTSSLMIFNESKASTRPKRTAEKQMHKDFVNSQTLKWCSANKIETIVKGNSNVKTKFSKINHERKIMSVVDVDKLLCLKCDKKFSSFSNLRRHAAIHIGWTRYKCLFCNSYKSYNRSECKHHVQRTHSVPENAVDKYIVNLMPDIKSGKKLPTSNVKLHKKRCLESKNKKALENKFKISNEVGNLPKRISVQLRKEMLTNVRKNIPQRYAYRVRPSTKNYGTKSPKLSSYNGLHNTQDLQKHGKSYLIKTVGDETSQIANLKVKCQSTPTTIILSKSCASSTVQIVRNQASNTRCASLKSAKVVQLKGETNKSLQKTHVESCEAEQKQVKHIIPCKILKQSGCENEQKSIGANLSSPNTVKRNKTISDWLSSNQSAPAITSHQKIRTAPLIIGLVPAEHSEGDIPI